MTLAQEIITIGMVVLGTALTRYLPFLLFPAGKPTPKYIQYLGKVLPGAVFGLLVIYSLRNVTLFFRKPWNTGTAGCSGGGPSPLMETADAAVYRRRNHPLYDFGADGLLKQMQNRECCG